MRAIYIAMMVSALGAVCALQAAPAPQVNGITVVVSDGPFAGTYTAKDTACLHVKDRNTLGCGWKDFGNTNTKRLEEAGIQVDTVSAGPGARTGDVIVRFLDGINKNMHDYSVSNVPMTLTRNGAVQQISFDGRTKDGVRMRVTGTIVEVEEF